MIHRIRFAACAALLLLAACSKGDGPETPPETPSETPPAPEQPSETLVRFTIRTGELAPAEHFGPVAAYLFDGQGMLYKTALLQPDAEQRVELATRTDTEAYFLAGATLPAEPGLTRSEFLRLPFGGELTHDNSAPSFFAAQTSFAAGAPASVTFRRRTARIDLDTSADATIAVTAVTLKGVPAATYPFVEQRAASDRTLTYVKSCAEPLAGRVEDLFRVYETTNPVEVTIAATCGGVPVQIVSTLPSIEANRIYTLALRNAGATLESSFEVAPWQPGDTVVGHPDTEYRIQLDPAASTIPDGVTVDYAANTVAIPAAGAALTLAFRAAMPVEIAAAEGLTEAVRLGERTTETEAGGAVITRLPLTVAPQGRGRLGYEVTLHLKFALLQEHYDYVSLRIAPSPHQIETVAMAGLQWMAFNARSRDLEDQIYPLDGCTVEQMYRTNWLACVGGLFQFGRLYMYTPWLGYNPANDLGNQKQDVPWRNDTHMPCPEGYRVPTPAELNALLPGGTTVPGSYRTATGEAVRATLLTAEGAISTPTGVSGTPRYVKLTAEADGRYLIIPLAGSKGDKSTTNNPGFGARAVLWTNDNTGMPGGWALTHTITYGSESALFEASRLQMEGFASLRCVKK